VCGSFESVTVRRHPAALCAAAGNLIRETP
jgi:hypothetical protein